MTKQDLLEQIEYGVTKAGHKFDPSIEYKLCTPIMVGGKIKEGYEKLATIEPHLGEKLVVMAPAGAGKGKAKK